MPRVFRSHRLATGRREGAPERGGACRAGRPGRSTWLAALLLIAGGLGAGCGVPLPRDPEGTLERVRGGTMRVGVVANEPFTSVEDGRPFGPEVELVQEFARGLKAEVEWTVGPEARLMEAVEHRELDLVLGGLASSTPYAPRVGLSQPYLRSRLMVGAPEGLSPPRELKGERVAVEQGHVAIALLEEKGAVPEATKELASAPGLRAGFDWQLEAWGYTPSRHTLKKVEVVMGVPPGENAWLRRLDLFLQEHSSQARAALVQAMRDGGAP